MPLRLARPRRAMEVVSDEDLQVAPESEQRENRRQQQEDPDLSHAVAVIAPEGREDPVVMPGVVQPELRAIPGSGNRLPPPTRTRDEQLREVRTAPDQPGELVGIEKMIHQACDPQRRIAKVLVPEPSV